MTPEQQKEATASLEATCERARALDFDADRFNELHEQHTNAQFVAGWNLPGCLPEMEPATFETVEEARSFLADAIREIADGEEDENTAADMNHAADQLEERTNHAGNIQSGPYVYWWNPNETPLADPDDAKEYADLCATLKDLDLEPDEADDAQDRARERIEESALSVEVRTGWYNPAENAPKPEEFNILLSTGGPATRIIGELDEHSQPESARFQFQDWGIPWEEVISTSDQRAALLSFAACFYFGE